MLKAYNHAPFIAQAIESALAQETTFEVEILVGEDCSTDGTREIVMSYGSRYPERVRVLPHERNLGMVGNTVALYAAARGEYVAWLDGDDYWISRDKLQRQVEFLDSHPDHALCFHESVVIQPDGTRHLMSPARGAETFALEAMLFGSLAASSSYLFRKIIDEFPPWFETLAFADFPLQILHAEQGLARFIPGILGAYRAGGASLSALGFDPASESLLRFWHRQHSVMYEALNHHFNLRHGDIIRTALLQSGPAAQRIYAVTPRSSRLRAIIWRLVRTRPILARVAIESAAALANVAAWAATTLSSWRRS